LELIRKRPASRLAAAIDAEIVPAPGPYSFPIRQSICLQDHHEHQSILETPPCTPQLWFDTKEKGAKAMKTQIPSKILAIAAAVMIGMATTGGAALARGGGGFGGGHVGGFGGAHIGGLGGNLAGNHVGGLAGPHIGGFGAAHIGGPSVESMGTLGHTHVSHELGHHHFRDRYGVLPLYDFNDCPWPADLPIESCPLGSDTE
jgi:hypothetical protein